MCSHSHLMCWHEGKNFTITITTTIIAHEQEIIIRVKHFERANTIYLQIGLWDSDRRSNKSTKSCIAMVAAADIIYNRWTVSDHLWLTCEYFAGGWIKCAHCTLIEHFVSLSNIIFDWKLRHADAINLMINKKIKKLKKNNANDSKLQPWNEKNDSCLQ